MPSLSRFRLLPTVAAVALLLSGCAATLSQAAQPNTRVTYGAGEEGYLAMPAASTMAKPAVVMIHEWWGLNEHIKSQADMLAREGYIVLAVDLFDGKVATTREQAMAQTQGLDQTKALKELQDAVAYLRARGDVNPAKVASLGWCFGGGWSLRLLKAQKDMAAGVMYYGAVDPQAANLTGLPPLLGIFGQEDTGPSPAQVNAFDAALNQAAVPHAVHIYPGAGHAFANPTGGDAYRPEAAADAWTKTVAWLNQYLK